MTPQVTIDIENVLVQPGQTLHVWLRGIAERGRESPQIQVELRVRPDGIPEIFCDGIEVQSFEVWKPLEAQ